VRIEDQLPKELKQQLEKMKSPKKKRRNKEKLTLREIENLMNMNVPTYKRAKGGAIRRK
jgi:hypothetical protein